MVLSGGLRRRVLCAAAVFFLALSPVLRAEVIDVKEYGYSLDLPEGWEPFDASNAQKLSFMDPQAGAMLQVTVVAHERGMTAAEMEGAIEKQLKAAGEGEAFTFSGRDAYLAEVTFSNSAGAHEGYILVVKGLDQVSGAIPSIDGILVCFAPQEIFQEANDDILSALDSFSPNADGKLYPGPLSQYLSPLSGGSRKPGTLKFLGQVLNAPVGLDEQQTTQDVIEREARLLARYKADETLAWQRYYRVLYRDSYHRLDGIYSALKKVMDAQKVSAKDAPLTLLSWIQAFTFERTGSLSDFLSPLSVALTASGDCDSRAILWVALLDHMGIDCVLFVSVKFAHAMGGAALDMDGASLTVDGKRYIVAEMTEVVAAGLIAKDMADPAAWIGMKLK